VTVVRWVNNGARSPETPGVACGFPVGWEDQDREAASDGETDAAEQTPSDTNMENAIESRLASLGIVVPAVPGPFGAYVPAKRVGKLIFVAGQLPMKDGKLLATGPVPSRCSIDAAKAAARQCVINALAAVRTVEPDLGRLAGVVRVGAFVSSDLGFTEQPKVANGASEFLIELFGDAGKHARAAVGVNTLPLDASVEVEFLFELR
jgi:enamine deaminase RidA (YjgF/YER057c/UK114 family)